MKDLANFYENRFGGSVFFEKRRIWRHFMTSYPTIFRKYTSSGPISLKNGTIAHFYGTSSQKKFRTIPTFLTSLWRLYEVTIFCRLRHFRRFWWRHNDVKNVGIVLNFFMRTFIVKMNNRANFYKNRNGGSLFSGNFFVLFYFTRLWDNGGSTTALFKVINKIKTFWAFFNNLSGFFTFWPH